MARITEEAFRQQLEAIVKATGDKSYSIEYEYGKVRLYRCNKSKNISPLLSKSELYEWNWAYLQGIGARQYRCRDR